MHKLDAFGNLISRVYGLRYSSQIREIFFSKNQRYITENVTIDYSVSHVNIDAILYSGTVVYILNIGNSTNAHSGEINIFSRIQLHFRDIGNHFKIIKQWKAIVCVSEWQDSQLINLS